MESGSSPSFSSRRGAPLLAGALLVAAVAGCFAGGLRSPFVFDDLSSIVQNPTLRSLWPPWRPLATPQSGGLTVSGRPLLNLSLAFNYAWSGNATWSYHLVNLAIHAASALLAFGILRRTFIRLRPGDSDSSLGWALGAAAIWALHPLQTSAVTYTVQRAESLMGFFLLLTLYAFTRGWLVLSCAACLLGMGAKEPMAAAPLLVLLYDRTFVSGSARAALRRRPLYYFSLAATWVPLALLVAAGGGNRGGSIGFGTGASWGSHLLTQFPAALRYLELALWPHPLAFEYEPVWATLSAALPAAAVVGALAAVAAAGLYRRRWWGYCGAWFAAIHAPTSLMPAPSEFVAEYRMYLPLLAVVAVVGGLLWRFAGPKGSAVMLLAAAALGCATAARERDYRSALALWQDTVLKRPGNALAHEMLGEALDAAGRRSDAIREHREAVRLMPGLSVAQDQLADDLFAAGAADEAIVHYRAAIRQTPAAADPHSGLGRALAAKGDLAGAVAEFEAALRAAPDFLPARRNLADAHYNLANALSGAGKSLRAIPEYEAALQLWPDLAPAHYNLGNSLAALGRYADAAAQFESALRIDPRNADAQCNLGAALAAMGRRSEAIAHYEAALRLRPDFADVREALRRLR